MDDAPKCYIKSSKIHGKGLFSTQRISKDSIVVDYNVKGIWLVKSFSELSEIEIKKCWWVGINETTCYIPTQELKFFYANHSNKPNCFWDRENKRLIANKNLEENEEITYNYNLEVKPSNWVKFDWL